MLLLESHCGQQIVVSFKGTVTWSHGYMHLLESHSSKQILVSFKRTVTCQQCLQYVSHSRKNVRICVTQIEPRRAGDCSCKLVATKSTDRGWKYDTRQCKIISVKKIGRGIGFIA
jgi:hypothetical protein